MFFYDIMVLVKDVSNPKTENLIKRTEGKEIYPRFFCCRSRFLPRVRMLRAGHVSSILAFGTKGFCSPCSFHLFHPFTEFFKALKTAEDIPPLHRVRLVLAVKVWGSFSIDKRKRG